MFFRFTIEKLLIHCWLCDLLWICWSSLQVIHAVVDLVPMVALVIQLGMVSGVYAHKGTLELTVKHPSWVSLRRTTPQTQIRCVFALSQIINTFWENNNDNNNNMQVLIKRIRHPTTSQCAAAYYYSIRKIVTIISLHLGRATGQVHTLLALRLKYFPWQIPP